MIHGNWQDIHYKTDDFYIIPKGSQQKIKAIKIHGEQHQYKSEFSFNSWATFPKQDADAFDAYFPNLIIDGIEIQIPVIHINKTIWTGLSPFNC